MARKEKANDDAEGEIFIELGPAVDLKRKYRKKYRHSFFFRKMSALWYRKAGELLKFEVGEDAIFCVKEVYQTDGRKHVCNICNIR